MKKPSLFPGPPVHLRMLERKARFTDRKKKKKIPQVAFTCISHGAALL